MEILREPGEQTISLFFYTRGPVLMGICIYKYEAFKKNLFLKH